MIIPQFLHPLTPDTKRLKFTWIIATVVAVAAFFYLAQTGKNGTNSLLHEQPAPKHQAGAYNPNNQQFIQQVYYEGADSDLIKQKKAALDAVKSQEGKADPAANREAEQQVTDNFDQSRQQTVQQQQKVSDFDMRLKTFMQPHVEPEVQQSKTNTPQAPPADSSWKTIAEIVAQKQLQPKATVVMTIGNGGNNLSASPTPSPTPQSTQQTAKEEYRKSVDWGAGDDVPNFIPQHVCPIPCILEDNIKTGALKQRVRALICQDVIYAYRIQLRAYSAMLVGEVASEPIGDTLDIHFDTIIFADGAELPISGTAYSPEDPRYPGEGNHRGVHGRLVTPPLYTKILSWLGNAAENGLQQYLNDSQEQQPSYGYGAANNSQFPSGAQTGTTTTTTVTDPTTGKQTVTQTQNFSAPNNLNPNYRARIAVAAGSSAASQLNQELQNTLQKYKPYVTVDRGYPVWVDLDQTINIGARRINGVMHAQMTEAEAEGKLGVLPKQPYYPPGDARDNSAEQVANPQLSAGLINPSPTPYGNTNTPYGVNGPSNANNAAIEQQLAMMRAAQQQRYEQSVPQTTPVPVPLPPNPNVQPLQ
jgi:hypothetical protein